MLRGPPAVGRAPEPSPSRRSTGESTRSRARSRRPLTRDVSRDRQHHLQKVRARTVSSPDHPREVPTRSVGRGAVASVAWNRFRARPFIIFPLFRLCALSRLRARAQRRAVTTTPRLASWARTCCSSPSGTGATCPRARARDLLCDELFSDDAFRRDDVESALRTSIACTHDTLAVHSREREAFEASSTTLTCTVV